MKANMHLISNRAYAGCSSKDKFGNRPACTAIALTSGNRRYFGRFSILKEGT